MSMGCQDSRIIMSFGNRPKAKETSVVSLRHQALGSLSGYIIYGAGAPFDLGKHETHPYRDSAEQAAIAMFVQNQEYGVAKKGRLVFGTLCAFVEVVQHDTHDHVVRGLAWWPNEVELEAEVRWLKLQFVCGEESCAHSLQRFFEPGEESFIEGYVMLDDDLGHGCS